MIPSNPSGAYIARVAQVFNGTATSARGDMQAVLRAVLLDSEARDDNPPAEFGRLRPPMQHTVALCRALNIDPGPAQKMDSTFSSMNERTLAAPTVFGHYSPLYHIAESALFGPEFQIYSPADAVNRANLFYSLISRSTSSAALQPFTQLGSTPSALVDAVDTALLHGRMLPATRAAILGALSSESSSSRPLAALYLTFTSGEYLVQR